jgi:hypothetical protein
VVASSAQSVGCHLAGVPSIKCRAVLFQVHHKLGKVGQLSKLLRLRGKGAGDSMGCASSSPVVVKDQAGTTSSTNQQAAGPVK